MSKIFVFGSNLAGRHGAGAALTALQEYGAVYGQGEGLQGQSYGIPTKDKLIRTLPLERVKNGVDQFIAFARSRPDLQFFVTRIGCGLAGYTDADIAPLFRWAPPNCELPEGWREAAGPIYFQSKGATEFRFLSNFWLSPISIHGQDDKKTWATVEHFYQSQKCAIEEDAERIRMAATPREAKELGSVVEMVPNWEEPSEWYEGMPLKVGVMLDGLRMKFRQNPDLKQKLLATGTRELVEYAPWGDTFWGVNKNLNGHNTLGKLLMRVREELRSHQCSSSSPSSSSL